LATLTELGLKSLTGKNVGESIYEGSIRGKVRATKNGISVDFTFKYKFEGKLKELSLASWPKKSLKEIRATATAARSKLDQGNDPISIRQNDKLKKVIQAKTQERELKNQLQQQIAQDKRITANALFENWLKLDLVNRKDSGKEIRRMFEKDVLPIIGEMAVEDIRKAHIINVIDILLARGVNRMTKLILSLMRQMFRFAQDRDIIEFDPTSSIRKAKIGGKDMVRDRVLSDAEIKALKSQLPEARLLKTTECALWIMLSTCCRIGEICKAEWPHLDIQAGTWKIPSDNSKNGKPHTIYLSEFAIRQFQVLIALKISERWIFPNTNNTNHVCEKSMTKQIGDRQLPEDRKPMSGRSKFCKALKLPEGKWTPHDLRRTGATIMGNLGVRPDVIEKCLNHIEQNKMKKTYQHQSLILEQQQAWKILGERLDNLTNG
jgi:integrase